MDKWIDDGCDRRMDRWVSGRTDEQTDTDSMSDGGPSRRGRRHL